jgi:hypothetical protein
MAQPAAHAESHPCLYIKIAKYLILNEFLLFKPCDFVSVIHLSLYFQVFESLKLVVLEA